jgi:outer membrane protein
MKRSIYFFSIVLVILFNTTAFAKAVRIALVKDGPSDAFLSETVVKKEIRDLLGTEFEVEFLTSKRTTADWTLSGVNQIISNLYSDSSTDIIVTLGPVASNEVSKRTLISKPTIAAMIINPTAQSFPLKENKSGRNNFAYITDLNDAGGEISFFSDFVKKRKIAVLVEPFLMDSWVELKQLLINAEKEYGVTFYQVAVTKNLNTLRQAIPKSTEAVMVGILSQHNETEIKSLAKVLIDLKLPSYTFMGERGVDLGFMVTQGQVSQDHFKISRRVALNIQRLLLGQNGKDLPVNIDFSSRLVFNQKTAFDIGFAPSWQKVISAKILHEDEHLKRRAFTVTQAIQHAIKNNLALAVKAINVDIAKKDLEIATTRLYPQLSLDANYTQIGQDQAFTNNPEKRADATLNLSQSIYSESFWASKDINILLLDNQDAIYQASVLDTALQAANAYLNLLSAKANETTRAANLELTKNNLELSKNRMRIGSAGKSDVLRFKSQLARDRQSLFSSVASRQKAELKLAKIINLSEGVLVDVQKPDVGTLLSIISDSRFQHYVSNQIEWQAFQAFYKLEAVANSPELKGFDAQLSVQDREILSNQRAHYIPDINLTAQSGSNFSQSGVGATDNTNKESWTVGVSASLQIDLSGQQRKKVSRAKLQLQQLSLNRQSIEQQIVSNTGIALFAIGSSYPSIQLSKEAESAAADSLELVQDAYAKGAVSISDLLDAQNNALSARLLSADAEYTFLQDYMSLMRSAGDFKPIINGKYSVEWFDKLHKFFRQQGVQTNQ